jgi:hypothetical protein
MESWNANVCEVVARAFSTREHCQHDASFFWGPWAAESGLDCRVISVDALCVRVASTICGLSGRSRHPFKQCTAAAQCAGCMHTFLNSAAELAYACVAAYIVYLQRQALKRMQEREQCSGGVTRPHPYIRLYPTSCPGLTLYVNQVGLSRGRKPCSRDCGAVWIWSPAVLIHRHAAKCIYGVLLINYCLYVGRQVKGA